MVKRIQDVLDAVDASISIAINALSEPAVKDRAATRAEIMLAMQSSREALAKVRDIKRSYLRLPSRAIVGSRSSSLRLVGGEQ